MAPVDPAAQGPARVVSLAPSNTELAVFLGCQERLVGVDDWSDWPPAVQDLARVGPDLQIDLDRVQALEPDLVLASASVPGMEAVVARVRQRGLPHVVLAPDSLDEVVEDARRLGAELGVAERGHALAEAMDTELARIGELAGARDRVRVYWEWWPKPAIAAGGPGWMTPLLELAGGRNVFAEVEDESFEVNPGAVAQAEPDVVAICWQGSLARVQDPARVQARAGWEAVEAVAQGRILDMEEALFGRPGPRLVQGAHVLAARLHPELEDALGEAYAWLPDEVAETIGPALDQALDPA